ncbi:hypothetical protein CCHR01_07275 [Colletotrichum chrysophilum]|uniref:Uncharacterized protein n=1 Tax=Colletotrichum chrysophilum TaxID=1836956 RepID=A0AAD9AKE8_9PEZI|nr:hypothetical protein CCHR01_07275 [Colletotrichum chrysophilum]
MRVRATCRIHISTRSGTSTLLRISATSTSTSTYITSPTTTVTSKRPASLPVIPISYRIPSPPVTAPGCCSPLTRASFPVRPLNKPFFFSRRPDPCAR